MLNSQDIQRVAEAFGIRHKDMVDEAGLRVVVSEHSQGFICCAALDPTLSCPSTIGMTDGTVLFSENWSQLESDNSFLKLEFYCIGSSFVAIEFFGNPERVFLYPSSPKFNLEHIIAQLNDHRLTTRFKNCAANDANLPVHSE